MVQLAMTMALSSALAMPRPHLSLQHVDPGVDLVMCGGLEVAADAQQRSGGDLGPAVGWPQSTCA